MGRRKIEIKAIKDDRNRSVTFLKRKGGLFKKAHELSVLCSVDVAVIIFGHNKKLYEFSSGDIQETLGRYSYYGGPHEHKGPEDFMGKKEADDDDDDDIGPEDRPDSHSPPPHAIMPHHLQNQPAFQHMGTPSASPPMPNGVFHHRGPSPQPPHPLSRPSSRAHIRHPSSNLVPPQHQHLQVTQPPQPQQPSYAYMPNPPIYNPQAAAGMQMRPQPGQPQPPQFQFTQAPPQVPPQHPQHQIPQAQMQPVYQQDAQRRQSGPPSLPAQQHPQQPGPQRSPQPPQQQFQQSPPLPQPKPLPASAKNNSIFTPIDDSRSLLAQHWGSTTQAEPQRSEGMVKGEPGAKAEAAARSQSIDVAAMNRAQINGVHTHPNPQIHHVQTTNGPPQPQRTASTPVISSIPPQPPSRTNSLQTGRPRLKVQIPSEQEEDERQTGGSSPQATGGANNAATPIRAGAVLPPPSPSAASALLSAGATGPPNPFARPAPPATNGTFGGNRSDLETPISALPSRFMSEQLLGSPSSFDWFNKDNTLPSPLASLGFGQTPLGQSGPSFRDDDADRKRKASDPVEENGVKRIKA